MLLLWLLLPLAGSLVRQSPLFLLLCMEYITTSHPHMCAPVLVFFLLNLVRFDFIIFLYVCYSLWLSVKELTAKKEGKHFDIINIIIYFYHIAVPSISLIIFHMLSDHLFMICTNGFQTFVVSYIFCLFLLPCLPQLSVIRF